MPPPAVVPTYLLHRTTGQARVRIGGRDHYLGKCNSPESRQAYARLITEHFRPGAAGAAPHPSIDGCPDISINELFFRYLQFAETYYATNGIATGEVRNIRDAIRSVRALYQLERAGILDLLRSRLSGST
jgi:hypothetical protein